MLRSLPLALFLVACTPSEEDDTGDPTVDESLAEVQYDLIVEGDGPVRLAGTSVSGTLAVSLYAVQDNSRRSLESGWHLVVDDLGTDPAAEPSSTVVDGLDLDVDDDIQVVAGPDGSGVLHLASGRRIRTLVAAEITQSVDGPEIAGVAVQPVLARYPHHFFVIPDHEPQVSGEGLTWRASQGDDPTTTVLAAINDPTTDDAVTVGGAWGEQVTAVSHANGELDVIGIQSFDTYDSTGNVDIAAGSLVMTRYIAPDSGQARFAEGVRDDATTHVLLEPADAGKVTAIQSVAGPDSSELDSPFSAVELAFDGEITYDESVITGNTHHLMVLADGQGISDLDPVPHDGAAASTRSDVFKPQFISATSFVMQGGNTAHSAGWQWNSGTCVYADGRPDCPDPVVGEDPFDGEGGQILSFGLAPALDADGEPGATGPSRMLYDDDEVYVETWMAGEWVTDGRMDCCGDAQGLTLRGGGLTADSADSLLSIEIPAGEVVTFDDEVFGPFDDAVALARRTRGYVRFNAR